MQSDFLANSGRFPPSPMFRKTPAGSHCSHRSKILRPTVTDAPLDARAEPLTCSKLPDAFHDDFLAATHSGLAAALAPGRPLHSAALRVANTAYDGFRPTTLFCALCGALKVLALVLAPDVDVAYIRAGVRRARKYRCGARASRAVSSDEVSLQALYKLGLLLSNVQALPTLRLQATLAIEVAKAEESPSRLVLWR
ncbi:hypothetical protein EDB89DRAFT_2076144 [Lactarius sanguifluus]|nr:hypothetical protein EDB89DRAFT_2076144 [Lactarius sanguifluus]